MVNIGWLTDLFSPPSFNANWCESVNNGYQKTYFKLMFRKHISKIIVVSTAFLFGITNIYRSIQSSFVVFDLKYSKL